MNPLADRRKKLTRDAIQTIRYRYLVAGWSQLRLARAFGISQQHVSLIVRGHRRKAISHD